MRRKLTLFEKHLYGMDYFSSVLTATICNGYFIADQERRLKRGMIIFLDKAFLIISSLLFIKIQMFVDSSDTTIPNWFWQNGMQGIVFLVQLAQ